MKQITCPICKETTQWEGNAYKPFCSARCKTTDLGNWASGKYVVESKEEAPSEEELNGDKTKLR